MQKIFFHISAFFIAITTYSQRNIDAVHYRYSVELNDRNDSIDVMAQVSVVVNENTRSFYLDLAGLNKEGKGMKVNSTRSSAFGAEQPSFTHDKDRLTINWYRDLKKGDTAVFTVFYKGIPADGLIISKNKYGKRTFFADNWPDRGHQWLACVDDPADKAAVDFWVTAPEHYQVVANGVQVQERNLSEHKKMTCWKEDVPVSPKVMVIGVAEFSMAQSGMVDNCIPVTSWVYPEDWDKGFYDYSLAVQILPYFIRNVGPYGYKKLANVQSKTIFGGLENANTIFYSENSVTGTRKSEGLLVHEIAHQWFGNMATEKTFAHLWLSEGFATYMTILYMENKYGQDTAVQMLQEDRGQVIGFNKKNIRPVVDHTTDYMELLNPNSYQKGSWILHMLRRQLGDTVFWKSIRKYYATYAGKTADSDDLRKVVESVSGKKLDTFFAQWLTSGVNPSLNISWKYSAKEKKVQVTVEQVQKETVFSLPLELELNFGNTKKVVTAAVESKTQTFSWAVPGKPLSVKADPNTSLLFEGNVREQQ